MGKVERLARLMECWRVLLLEWEQALRWRDRDKLRGLVTALKLVDACIHAEDGIADPLDHAAQEQARHDQAMMRRLREIAQFRNILHGVDWGEENAAPVEQPESSA